MSFINDTHSSESHTGGTGLFIIPDWSFHFPCQQQEQPKAISPILPITTHQSGLPVTEETNFLRLVVSNLSLWFLNCAVNTLPKVDEKFNSTIGLQNLTKQGEKRKNGTLGEKC